MALTGSKKQNEVLIQKAKRGFNHRTAEAKVRSHNTPFNKAGYIAEGLNVPS